eukprot:CAMPEP_0202687642 /NCGR_PEP_ID=MMETSP1385-20130828/3300_1 /ASSEMBLY_ACC=CAM_ASM_000861 /TAXON_ID=933848 /ORGANISM="Elphidium margaritaceum" /LENGTH=372 /DNA_ID=CAMNT_0049342471 /DNA_START=71 /DNA_END=1189 /DNA_ORIENTATION=-
MVKYLHIPSIESLNASLQRINFGDHSVCGRLSCYSLKMVQKDKKLVKHLQREYSNEKIAQQHINVHRHVDPEQLDDSIQRLVQVPVGNLHEFSTVRLISYFISTLNTTYTDFDFTSCEPDQFEMEKAHLVTETINARLAPLYKSKPLLMDSFWKNINAAIDLQQCQFYSFRPNEDTMQVLRPHSLWNVDYFIVNVKKKQLLYLALYAQNNLFYQQQSEMNSCDDEFKMHMIDEMDIDDGMAWCSDDEMSPHSKPHHHHHSSNHKKKKEKKSTTTTTMTSVHSNSYSNYDTNTNTNTNRSRDTNRTAGGVSSHTHVHGVNVAHTNLVDTTPMQQQQQQRRKQQSHGSGGNPLQVMSINNCLSGMPELECPSDL